MKGLINMKTVHHITNPTRLLIIDRKLATIRLERREGLVCYNVDKLDLEKCSLPPGKFEVVLTAFCGSNRWRHSLGYTDGEISFAEITNIDAEYDKTFKFRIVFLKPGEPKIIAMIDGIRPNSFSETNVESLIPMERMNLGERIWNLHLDDQTGPTLQINDQVFASALAASNNVPFATLVVPEVLRVCLDKLVRNRSLLDGDGPWSEWKGFIEDLGVDMPDEDSDNFDVAIMEMVKVYCDRKQFATNLKSHFEEGGEANA